MDYRRPRHSMAIKFLFIQFALLVLGLLIFSFPATTQAAPQAQSACGTTGDFGDGPASYGVACAVPSSTLHIGSTTPVTVTDDPSHHSAAATWDTTENFLNPLTPIDIANSQYLWTVPLSNTTGGSATLAGWIDFNHDGVFQANEGVSVTVPNNSTAVTLTWNIPVTATYYYTQSGTATNARLRISTNASVGPTGSYGIGEVEDYAATLVESYVCTPGTSFYFIQGNGAANNALIEQATINGSSVITTLVNDPPTPASGLPNINGLGIDHYRGIIYYQDAADSTTPKGIYGYDVRANTNFTVTADATSLGLNLASGWSTASGAFANGKYYAGIDGDDSGDVWEITLNSAGTSATSARLVIANPDTGCGRTACNGYGDVLVDGNRMYIALWNNNSGGFPEQQVFDVWDINSQTRLSRQIISATGFAFQLARDGNGQIYVITSDNGRIFTVSNNAIQNYPTPVATIGSIINDASECPIVPMDFGDAPNYYGTDVGPLAARSTLTSTIRLGTVSSSAVISDLHGYATSDAKGDDTNTGTNDEDAVSSVPSLTSSASSYSLPSISVFNNSGSNVFLYGWVDFNRDGVFSQSELVSVTVPSSASQQSITLTWTIPGGHATTGQSFIRLRISPSTVTTSTNTSSGSDGAFLATGFAPNGEVEDYALTIGSTTAVVLSSFNATAAIENNTPFDVAMRGISIGAASAILLIAGLVVVRKRRRQRGISPPT